MKERTKRGTRLRRMTVVLAFGIAIGTMIVATPAQAHFRSSIDHIWSHIKPKADARYVNESQLKTLRGTYSITDKATAASEVSSDGIAFYFTLPSAPTPHIIRQGETPPAECPGTTTLPQAAPGHLCVYEAARINTGTLGVQDPSDNPGTTTRFGTNLFLVSNAAGHYESRGTWAVTRP